MSCLPNNSLIKPTDKFIKAYKEDFVLVEGANMTKGVSFSNLKIPYEQFFTTTLMIKEDTQMIPIQYGALGEQITFLAIKVSYEPLQKSLTPYTEIPYLQYFYETNEQEVRTIDSLLVLTGTKEYKLPKVFLNNPNKKFKARVEILAATSEIDWTPACVLTPINDLNFTVQDLVYTNLVSDNSGYSIIIQLDSLTPIVTFAIDQISNLEISGRLLIVDDTSIGKVNLFFKTEFDCLQAYSLFYWVFQNPIQNKITLNMAADTTAPIIEYKSSFTTNFLLSDYPTNGTDGSNGYSITLDTLLEVLTDKATDVRDGDIYLSTSNFTLTPRNQNNKITEITTEGRYSLIIEVKDTAGNKTTEAFMLYVATDLESVSDEEGNILVDEYGNYIVF